MKLVHKFIIPYREDIARLCRISNNLYNQALYVFRETLSNENKWLFYNDSNKIMRETKNMEGEINYRLMKAQCSQQTLKELDVNIKSFLKSIKDWKKNPSKYKGKPELPKYKKRGGMSNVYFTNQSSKIKDGKIILGKGFEIEVPQWEEYKERISNFNQIRIKPLNNNKFMIYIVYERNEEIENPSDKYASIDIGVNNLATVVTENGVRLFRGKYLKSKNVLFNKRISHFQSIKDKQGIKKSTNRIKRMYSKRDNYINDALHKTSRMIVDILKDENIGTLVVGYNGGWKQNINTGKRNNQHFSYIPFARLVSMLEYKCKLEGIKFVKHEESYTSKCDALAFEEIGKHEKYLGSRIKRGLFRSSTGQIINADVNGALNILRKVAGDSSAKRIISRGLLSNPVGYVYPFTA